MSRRNHNDKFLNNVDLRKPLSDHPIWQDVRGVWLPVPQLSGGRSLRDISGLDIDGVLASSASWGVSQFGVGLEFPGANDSFVNEVVLRQFTELDASVDYTMSLWVRVDNISRDNDILANNVHAGSSEILWWFDFDVTNHWKLMMNGTVVTSVAVPTQYQWTHIVLTRTTGSNAMLFIDGLLDKDAGALSYQTSANALRIGAAYNTTAKSLHGGVRGFCIWGRGMQSDEIATLYDQSLKGYPDLIRRIPTLKYFFPAVAHTFYDTFVDTAGTSLDAHTPDIGSNWTEQQGNFTIKTSGEVAIQ